MALITLIDAHLAFGHVALLDKTGFSLESGERVGLIGRNGAGKSSLLKILGGMEKPDDGMVQFQQGVRLAFVAQEPLLNPDDTVFTSVSAGLKGLIQLIEQYTHSQGDLDALQSAIEAQDGWNWEQRVEETLHRLRLDKDALSAHCPAAPRSGWHSRRRWSPNPTCCCWTNPPTTWTWTRSSGWSNC
jgi:ATP-binding cassette subfamily F protein uup